MSKSVLFELGVEELPARFINNALAQLEEKTAQWLKEQRVPFGEITGFATPRRLAVKITEVEEKQPDIEEEAKGPAKKIALDDEGNWTKAAIGFSKGQGKSVEDIYFKEINGTEYVHVNKFIEGEQTTKLLEDFREVFLSLTFPKNMRWGNRDLRYARPIRWMVAIFGKEIIPFSIEGVNTGNRSFGHRFLGSETTIVDADQYESLLKDEYVIASVEERKAEILSQLKQLEKENDWKLILDEGLLDEVTHLVEYPTVFSGEFSEEFLEVPEEALITSMKEHQRYFPVRSSNGRLLPCFVGVRNGDDQYIDTVARGNEKVLKARLKDAQFFFEEDQKGSIDEKMQKLSRMVYQEELGTLADKVQRIIAITGKIGEWVGLEAEQMTKAKRAAEICKFDLVTQMVDEFTELQGVMGEKYARIFGEEEEVAMAINEHYMPRQASGAVPSTTIGSIVSIADKLDTIVGSISIGIIPTGSQDPYGLRRQALGILQTLTAQGWSIPVEKLIDLVHQFYYELDLPTREKKDVRNDLQEFFQVRAAYLMKEDEIDPDVVEAVLATGIGVYPATKAKAILLVEKRQDPSFKSVHEALGRVLNLARKAESAKVDPKLFENDKEHGLFNAYQNVHDVYRKSMQNNQPQDALNRLSELAKPIHDFFDETMVMAEDEAIRHNRLALLKQIAEDVYAFADLNAIEWKQQF
ncbi:glycine--tRNA ligase subunit beta [Halobacillus karajensis]|uniref:Glycine--tRNA ligase beta subunit n=1 Tax=Halobacillus karajensis TaxID=195088 RepID=A0A024P6U7_9BACI|nr:glycine--tRNA ligase subunit beta [Halobacillus karajensis]CDQ18031.1 Glycine--tRNA ligase beta subunit [Halobacillus karajensis]CDQ24381.1 Glycine--tRNA ligase beta subunit [Halobacillus karajensis]CDQ29371.1 Glycine--tRNA ligase beta subunit [Halobacillus karajensis]